MQRKLMRYLVGVTLLLLLLTPALSVPTTRAYNHASDLNITWGATRTLVFGIDPNLDQELGNGVTNTASYVRSAASTWNKASLFSLIPIQTYDRNDANQNFVTTADLTNPNSNSCGAHDNQWAIVCINYDPTTGIATTVKMFLNNVKDPAQDPLFYNTNGIVQERPDRTRRDIDVYDLALHEFGHFCCLLGDHPPGHDEAVMNFDATAKGALTNDDKEGTSMLQFPYTGFEPDQAQGLPNNRLAYAQGVTGYAGAPIPEMFPVPTDRGVAPNSGSWQQHIAGTATAATSYSYFTTFSWEDDSSNYALSSRRYAQIDPNSNHWLHWCQYNYQQATMSVDFEMDNGATLRDSGLMDTANVPVHPSARGGYGTNRYVCSDVDLSPLAGRKIVRWFLAYDSGANNNAIVGQQFRAYFDDLKVTNQCVCAAGTSVVGSGSVATNPARPWAPNTPVTFTATPSAGWLFTGWTINGYQEGWANPLTATVDDRFSVVANFAPLPTFGDVPSDAPSYEAVKQLAARGIIKGCDQAATPPLFCPNDTVVRAQSAAFIARAMPGWDGQDWGNPFPDKCDPAGQNCIDNNLWRNVGTLNHYGVATGYTDTATCSSAGTTAPCYLPRQGVLNIQVISFLTRAMIARGYWARQPDNPSLYTNVPASGTQRSDLATYVFYAGAIPGRPTNGPFTDYDQPAPRSFFAQAEWQALDSYFRVDRVP